MIQYLIVDNVKSFARAISDENVIGSTDVFPERKPTAKGMTLFVT